jgi:AraC-like DNA-binding protein
VLRPFFQLASEHGISAEEILFGLGLDAASIASGEARLETAISNLVVSRICDMLPKTPKGWPVALAAADKAALGELGLYEVLMASAASMRDACNLATQFYRLLDDSSQLKFEERGSSAVFHLIPSDELPCMPVMAEFAFAMIARIIREGMRRDLRPTEVRLRHSPGAEEARLYERYYRTTVIFGAPEFELLFPKAFLALSVPTASAPVHEAVKERASAMISQMPPRPSYVDRVRQTTTRALGEGAVSLRIVAERLDTSPRTLQRRLQENGTTFDTVLEEVQRELAMHLVASGELPIGEVAHRVGFLDPCSFSRAFRRWTQSSPSNYRAQRMAG